MNYTFEKFTGTGSRYDAKISLGEKSGFGLSSGFTRKYDLEGTVGVNLFYDKSSNAVAFKFLKQKEKDMAGVSLRPNKNGGYINAKAFLTKYDINQSTCHGQYDVKEIEDASFGKLYVIELKKN
jgi:hypothetical protein